MAEPEWVQIAIGAGSSLVSGVAGMVGGAWRAGRRSAHHEQSVKDDYTAKIAALREEMKASISGDNKDSLVGQFKESFGGIRRQLDDHRLDVEKRFLLKDDFRDFRDEYREDMRDLKKSIANIAGQRQ